MLVVVNENGDILMLRRPQTGIWGGLWVLPELETATKDCTEWCRRELGLAITEVGELAPVSHGFTHFELEIRPILCELRGLADGIMDAPEFLWYNRDRDSNTARPVAMDKIFELLGEG